MLSCLYGATGPICSVTRQWTCGNLFRYTPVNPNLLYFYCFSNLLLLMRFYIESLIFDIGLNCQTKFEHNNLKNCTSHILYNGISKKEHASRCCLVMPPTSSKLRRQNGLSLKGSTSALRFKGL